MLYSKEGSHDDGYSHSRVVLSMAVQPSPKTLLSHPSASDGVSPNSRIELLAVFTLEILAEWFAGIDLTIVQQLQCELIMMFSLDVDYNIISLLCVK